MPRATRLSLVLLVAPLTLSAQQLPPAAPHDTVRGAISAVDVRARTLDVTTGVGFALRIVRLAVPAGVPITDRDDAAPERIALGELRRGDVVRAVFGVGPKTFLAYTIERVGRMETGVDSTPAP